MPKINTTENVLGTKKDTEQNDRIEIFNSNINNNITDVQFNITKQNILNDNGSLTKFHNKNNQTKLVNKVGLLKQNKMAGGLPDVNDLAQTTTKITELESSNDTIPEKTRVKDGKR